MIYIYSDSQLFSSVYIFSLQTVHGMVVEKQPQTSKLLQFRLYWVLRRQVVSSKGRTKRQLIILRRLKQLRLELRQVALYRLVVLSMALLVLQMAVGLGQRALPQDLEALMLLLAQKEEAPLKHLLVPILRRLSPQKEVGQQLQLLLNKRLLLPRPRQLAQQPPQQQRLKQRRLPLIPLLLQVLSHW